MAEILLRIIDSGPDAPHSKRGDAIAICPDGWNWSPRELSNPDWRIVRVVGLSESVELDLITPEPQVDSADLAPKLFRLWKVDVDTKLPSQVRNFLARARTGTTVDLEITLAQLTNALTKKK